MRAPSSKRMKQTSLLAAPGKMEAPPRAPHGNWERRTGSQLMRRVRQARGSVALAAGLVPVVRQDVAITWLQVACLDESDALAARVRAKHPRDVFHLAQGRLASVGIAAAGADRKGNAGACTGKLSAVYDAVLQAGPLNDSGMATGEAEGRLPMLNGAALNLKAHGRGFLARRCVSLAPPFVFLAS